MVPKPDVFHRCPTGYPGPAGGPEHLLEVVGLASVDNVEDQLRPQLRDPHLDGGHVGGPVQECAVGGLEHEGCDLGLVFGPTYLDHHRSVGPDRNSPGKSLVHERSEQIADRALPVPEVELDPQVGEVPLLGSAGHPDEVFPERHVSGPARLEIGGGLPGFRGDSLVLRNLAGHLGIPLLEIGEGQGAGFLVGTLVGPVEEVRQVWTAPAGGHDEHAHLEAPVAEVDVSQHVVSRETEEARDGVPDDGCPEVPDVHSLGDVRPRIVHYYLERVLDRGHAQPLIPRHGIHAAGEGPAGNGQVDEAGPGDRHRREPVVALDLRHHLPGYVARVTSSAPGGTQRAVALELAQIGTIRDLNCAERGVQSGGHEAGRDDRGEIGEKAHTSPAG